MSFKLIHCVQRHCVFTIDEELCHFFLEDHSLLDCLFQAVRSVVLRMFHNINKSKNFVPGFICVLHTFGHPLEWRINILLSFGYDPLNCPKCEHEMQFVELYYDHHRVSLEELYERAMAKAKCRSA